ncbi:MAG: N-acetyl-gamma-glutamyl-phosphate reductase [Nitrospira sp.]|nr:N-acetyl-gamma-glutamyl-phosphate reductase [Nitrospira sp.]
MRLTRLKVAVLGASGYTGGELLRLLDGHPYVTVTHVTADKSVGLPVTSLFPHLETFHEFCFAPLDVEPILKKIDVVFSCLPHTKAMEPVAACVRAKTLVVDLSADFRLTETKTYEQWYGTPHTSPALLKKAVYGLPELHRTRIRRARLVAAPGCYPTAAILQLAPLLAHRLIQAGTIVVDAKSGISGAGRSPGLPYHFPEAHDSLTAYNIARHRHTPEIEQELNRIVRNRKGADVNVVFTPHLIPMNRGLLSTAYAKLRKPLTNNAATMLYKDFYANERFVRIREESTSVSPTHVRGSNFCDIGVFVDQRTNHVVTVSTLDNLVKGAAGQAIQSMNLMMGFPEETALTAPGVFP